LRGCNKVTSDHTVTCYVSIIGTTKTLFVDNSLRMSRYCRFSGY